MSESTPGTVAFVFYVLLFAWVGFRRGLFRELSVLAVSVGGFFLLQQNQGLALEIVRQVLGIVFGIVAVGAKFLASLRAGDAGGSSEPVYTLGPSDWLSDTDQPTVSFLVWAGLLLFTYLLTNKAIPDSLSSSGLLAGRADSVSVDPPLGHSEGRGRRPSLPRTGGPPDQAAPRTLRRGAHRRGTGDCAGGPLPTGVPPRR